MHCLCRLGAETTAFEREYVDDHSWEELQEDEQGHLRALVRTCRAGGSRARFLHKWSSGRLACLAITQPFQRMTVPAPHRFCTCNRHQQCE